MPFAAIAKDRFDSLDLPESCRVLWPREHEVAWFANSAGTMLGVILANPKTGYYGYALCDRINGGEFERVGFGADFPSIDLARRDLIANMERHAAAHG